MPKKLEENIALERVLEKCKEKNLEFRGWVGGIWKGSNKAKLILYCTEHNHEWYTTAFNNFMTKNTNCPICSGKLTTESFTIRAINKHNHEYDYSDTEYTNSKIKIRIKCKIHGYFFQSPHYHLKGQGCPICSLIRKTSNSHEFTEKAKTKHNNYYDYSQVEYKGNKIPVIIICPKHGMFQQTPKSHLRGNGCRKCSGKYIPTTEEWIEKAHSIHGNIYNYVKVIYKNWNSKVCIICPEHGEFWQTPNDHVVRGNGCAKCSGQGLNTKEWIERFKKVHINPYDYSKFKYIGHNKKSIIICLEHGEFWQTPSNHYHLKRGCPKCHYSLMEITTGEYLNTKNIQYKKVRSEMPWLKNPKTNKSLELDFYLPDYNIAIECQGIQHFESIDYWGGEEALKDTQHRDKIKKQLCEENGVKLYYIKYNDSVEERLNEILSNYL